MAATQRHNEQTPTMLPGTVNGWTGRYKACRDCGTQSKMEIEDGICLDCYAKIYGPAGLRMAQARKEAAPKTTLTAVPVEPWHDNYDACLDCGKADKRYASRGLCTGCYPLTLKPGYTGNAAPKQLPPQKATVTPEPPPGPPEVLEDLPITLKAEPKPPAEPLVPTVIATAVVEEVQATTAPTTDPADIPLSELMAEVTRLVTNLATRVIAAEDRAVAAEIDAAKFRQIRAVIG